MNAVRVSKREQLATSYPLRRVLRTLLGDRIFTNYNYDSALMFNDSFNDFDYITFSNSLCNSGRILNKSPTIP